MNDSSRLGRLHYKRLTPPSCGGGLRGAEDEEEALLTARIAAYRHTPEGRDRERMLELTRKGIFGCHSEDEQKELDRLELLYPEPELLYLKGPSDSPLVKAIELKLAELRQRSK